MQNFGVTNKEHYGMLWYFLEWTIRITTQILVLKRHHQYGISALAISQKSQWWRRGMFAVYFNFNFNFI